MEQSIDWSVRQRAGNACEYCHMPQAVRVLRFQIDHIIARHTAAQPRWRIWRFAAAGATGTKDRTSRGLIRKPE